MTNVESQFIDAMRTRGLVLRRELIADGHVHRCDIAEKGPAGRGDGSYCLYLNGSIPGGWFKNWTDGQGSTPWHYRDPNRNQLTLAERQEIAAAIKRAHTEAAAEQEARWGRARVMARRLWDSADEAPAWHPYCAAKQVKPKGLRSKKNSLLIPIYDEHEELQSLQFIHEDCKRFLKGGRIKFGHFWIKEPSEEAAGQTICVCEGWSTGESIYQATKHVVLVAFSCGALLHVGDWARNQYPDSRIIICADDDWKTEGNPGSKAAWEAAKAIKGLVAMPRFKQPRADEHSDFNDMARVAGVEAVKRAIEMAVGVLPETSKETEEERQARQAKLDELAKLSGIEYDLRRKQVAEELGVRRGTIDSEVEKRRREKEAAPEFVPDPAKVEASAAKIIHCKDVLALFAGELRKLIAGEEKNAKVLYLAATSRLFDRAMHTAIKGPSAAGKSQLRKQVLTFFPPEDVISFTALSEKALLYMPDDLGHKILSMGEALTDREVEFQDMLLRELMSEGILRYPTVQKIHGEMQTITLVKEGPVAFIVTTTRNKLNAENETRMLSLEVDDSEGQTKQVMHKVAAVVGYGKGSQQIDFAPWHNFQRWLAAGECRVIVPFSNTLAKLIPPRAVRLRRDFEQVLRAVQAHALLHREHRERDERGRIKATISGDYANVCELLADVMAETAEVKMREAIAETIEAVKAVQPEYGPDVGERGASVRQIADRLKLDISAVRRRLYAAEGQGFIVNLETRERRPAHYRVTDQQPTTAVELLPTPEVVVDQIKKDRR